MQMCIFLLISRQSHQLISQQYTSTHSCRCTCGSPLRYCPGTDMLLNHRLNARESIININLVSDMISLGRIAGTGPYSADDGSVTVVIGSDKWSTSEAHGQPQRGPGVYDGKA